MNLNSVKLMLATLLMCLGFNVAFAAETEVPVKMTYVSGTAANVDAAYGELTEAQTGYNKISGGAVILANSGWGANNVIYLQVDASSIEDQIKSVTLTLDASGIDDRRTSAIGVGYNASVWSSDLTWNTADKSITTLGNTQGSESKSASVFTTLNFDITEALANDEDKIVTILVYDAAAGAANIKNVKAVAEYSAADQVLVSYSFDNAENPVLALDGDNDDRGTANYDYSRNESPFLNVWGANNTNGSKLITVAAEDVTSYGQWTLEFDWAGYSGCNKRGGYTQLRDAAGNTIFSIDDAANWGNTFALGDKTISCYPCNKATRISANTGSVLTPELWHHITVIGSKNGVSVYVQDYNAEGALSEEYSVKNYKASAENANPSTLALRPGSCGSVAIDNLKLTVGDLKIVNYTYTVKFVDQNGEEFKDSEERSDVAGTILAVTDADKATIVNGKTQYEYVSDDANEQSLDGEGMVITITYNKTSVADYIVKFVDANGTEIKADATHKNVNVGTEVSATSSEKATILYEGALYEYQSGAEALTVAEDEASNVITLVFASVEGVTAYAYKNYEDGAVDWTSKVSGRTTPIIVNGANVAQRSYDITHNDTTYVPVYLEDGITPMPNSIGEDSIQMVVTKVIDETVVVDFANKSKFLGIDPSSTNNNGAQANSASLAVDQNDFTYEAKLLIAVSNDQNCSFLVNNLAGDAAILKMAPAAVKSTNWVINDNDTISLPGTPANTGTTIDKYNYSSWYTVKVTVFKGYTFLTITDEAGEKIVENKQINTLANTYGVGTQTWNSGRYYGSFAIDDILVRNVLDEDKPAGFNPVDITYNYVDQDGKKIKASETIQLNKGDEINIRDNYKTSFKVDAEGNLEGTVEEFVADTKYIYASDNSNGVTATDGAQINIVFRATKSYRFAVRYKTMVDGVATNTNVVAYDSNNTGDKLFEGDVITVFTPLYVWINGTNGKNGEPTLYNGPKSGYPFSISVTVPELTKLTAVYPEEFTVTPATVDETDEEGNVISSIVYFSETEDIEGITVVNDTYTNIRMSNGKTGSAIGGPVKVTSLEPGKYTITSSTRSGKTNFVLNGATVFEIESAGAINTATSGVITVNKTANLYIAEQKAVTQYNDYVIIKKVGESDGIAVTSAGYATYSSSKDVSIKTPGVTAYKASVDYEDNLITLTALDGYIPAGTGVILYSESAKTIEFEEAAGAAADVTGNDLIATTTPETPIVAVPENSEESIIWVLGRTNQFLLYTGSEFAGNSAYIQTEILDASSLRIVINDNATAINSVNATALRNGKFIKNNSVVIVKNGQKYNVAGQIIK